MSAGSEGSTSGSSPTLQASASSTAHTLLWRSTTRAPPSATWSNSPAKPVIAWISRSRSGRSTRGIVAPRVFLSLLSEAGSSSLSSLAMSRESPSVPTFTAAFSGRFSATRR